MLNSTGIHRGFPAYRPKDTLAPCFPQKQRAKRTEKEVERDILAALVEGPLPISRLDSALTVSYYNMKKYLAVLKSRGEIREWLEPKKEKFLSKQHVISNYELAIQNGTPIKGTYKIMYGVTPKGYERLKELEKEAS